ncbi:Hypothetical predicted protein [Lecanosticta acicola]|uniref:Uncharacterized protein n=1 Tax=Lecanosticta acicola TaxID=111012 RepID=A0AAI8YWT0_9PEZI|nr:Hypothetical predicted protein [Lecanosticta acicola]
MVSLTCPSPFIPARAPLRLSDMEAIYLEEYKQRMREKRLHYYGNSHPELDDWQAVLVRYKGPAYQVSDTYNRITGIDEIPVPPVPSDVVVVDFSWLDRLASLAATLRMLLTSLFWLLRYALHYGFRYVFLPAAALLLLMNLYSLLRLHRVALRQHATTLLAALFFAFPARCAAFCSRNYAFYRYTDREIQIWDGAQSRAYVFNPCDELRLRVREATAKLWERVVRWVVYFALVCVVFWPLLLRLHATASPPPSRPQVRFVSLAEAAGMGWDVPLWAQMAQHRAFQGERTHFPRAVAASQWERPTTAEGEGASTVVPMAPSVEGKTFCRVNAKATQKNATRTAAEGINHHPSLPQIIPQTPQPPPQQPHETPAENFQESLNLPPFEEPRRAPQPPKRPPRPPSEQLFLPSSPPPPPPPPGIFQSGSIVSRRPQRTEILPPLPPPLPPPPIPQKSPLRRAPATKKQPGPRSPATPSTENSPPPHSETARDSFNTALRAHTQAQAQARRESAESSLSLSSDTSQSTTASSVGERVGRMARSATAPAGTLTRVPRDSPLAAVRTSLLMGSGGGGGSSRSLPTRSKHARKISIASSRSLDAHLARVAAEGEKEGGAASSSGVAAASDGGAASLQLVGSRREEKRPNAVLKPTRSPQPLDDHTRGKRRKKGETMSMLLETGFFPIEEITYGTEKEERRPTSKDGRIDLPPRLSFLNESLPSTPGSNALTPTELCPNSPSPTTPITPRSTGWKRKSGAAKRSLLSQIPEYDCKANGGGIKDESESISPSRLEAIPEDNGTGEDSRPASIIETPVATQIHLRGGSVVTVTPPELTAWQATVYLHGPIKLPKPAIMPRKNSVASLEAFQEAIDRLYQHALQIPRRRSDDAVVDDICDFFDDFGFEWVSFEGDRLSVDYLDVDEVEEMADAEAEQPERFSTPPSEAPAASPVEVTIAKEVLDTTSKVPLMTGWKGSVGSIPQVVVPPVENEETLRAKGIARLSRSSRGSASSNPLDAMAEQGKDSLTSKHGGAGGLQLLPAPEESMLDAVLQAGRRSSSSGRGRGKGVDSGSVSGSVSGSLSSSSVGWMGGKGGRGRDKASVRSSQRSAGEQGFDWDDEVEEMDAGSTWMAGVAARKKPVRTKRRKSGSKMRRLVATASTML